MVTVEGNKIILKDPEPCCPPSSSVYAKELFKRVVQIFIMAKKKISFQHAKRMWVGITECGMICYVPSQCICSLRRRENGIMREIAYL